MSRTEKVTSGGYEGRRRFPRWEWTDWPCVRHRVPYVHVHFGTLKWVLRNSHLGSLLVDEQSQVSPNDGRTWSTGLEPSSSYGELFGERNQQVHVG
jgi:hypothetical protein